MTSSAVAPAAPPKASGIPQRSLAASHGFRPLHVEGALPDDLRGTLYRVGPGLLERFGKRIGHPFEADGYIGALRLDGKGNAEGACRLIESAGYLEEERAGKILYGSDAPWHRRVANFFRGRDKNTANTSAFVWQGRLFALMEGALPTAIDERDLKTLGEDRFGVVHRTFSAHPHRVESLRCTFNFGMRIGKESALDIYKLPDAGPAELFGSVELPWPALVHDFAVTERHAVFLICPGKILLWKALLQIGSFSDWVAWEPSLGAEIVVVPLDDPKKARRKAIDPFWVWHFSNAFERGGEVVVDLSRYADLGSLTALGGGAGGAPPSMWRARIDLGSLAFSMEQIWDAQAEFPRVHPARFGAAYRDCWVLGKHAQDGEGIARLDVESGQFEWWTPSNGDMPSEPVVVPREGSSERDAWVLCLVDSPTMEKSYVAVLDAKAPQSGPVARVWFDTTLPRTFHGTWQG